MRTMTSGKINMIMTNLFYTSSERIDTEPTVPVDLGVKLNSEYWMGNPDESICSQLTTSEQKVTDKKLCFALSVPGNEGLYYAWLDGDRFEKKRLNGNGTGSNFPHGNWFPQVLSGGDCDPKIHYLTMFRNGTDYSGNLLSTETDSKSDSILEEYDMYWTAPGRTGAIQIGNRLWVCTSDNSHSFIVRYSDDNGQSWKQDVIERAFIDRVYSVKSCKNSPCVLYRSNGCLKLALRSNDGKWCVKLISEGKIICADIVVYGRDIYVSVVMDNDHTAIKCYRLIMQDECYFVKPCLFNTINTNSVVERISCAIDNISGELHVFYISAPIEHDGNSSIYCRSSSDKVSVKVIDCKYGPKYFLSAAFDDWNRSILIFYSEKSDSIQYFVRKVTSRREIQL